MAAMDRDTFIPVGASIAKLLLIASGQGTLAAAVGEGAGLLARLRGMLEIGGKRAAFAEKIADDAATQLLREHQRISEADWHVAARLVASLIDRLSEKKRLVAEYDWRKLRQALLDLGGTDLRSNLVDESARQSFDWVLEVACQHIVACFTEKEMLVSILESVEQVRAGIQRLADRPAGASQTRAVVADHIEVVRDLAPDPLEDRERELAELEAFVRGTQDTWYTMEASMVSGKTALMSSFALNPPDDACVVSFFARRIGGDGNDWRSFSFVAGAQLSEILGDEYTERVSDPASQDTEFRQLLRQAATAWRSDKNPRPLVLLIDGVDEDSYYERPDDAAAKSILSLLPRHLPEGVKVTTASRLNPRLPEDIVCNTPRVIVSLKPSPIAQKKINQKDIETFFKSDFAADIGAFLAACGGSLTIDELRQLVSMCRYRDNVSSRDIKACVDRSPGRMLMRVNVGFGGQGGVSYALGHDAVLRAVVREIAPDLFGDDSGAGGVDWWAQNREEALKPYREIVRKWVVDRAGEGWGRATPNYMLSNACFNLMLNHDIQVVLDPGRYNEMRRRFGRRSRVLRKIDLEYFKTLDVNRGEVSESVMTPLLDVAELRESLARASIYFPGLPRLYVSYFSAAPEDALDVVLSVDEPKGRMNALSETMKAAMESGCGYAFSPLFRAVLESLVSCRDLHDEILCILVDMLASISCVRKESQVDVDEVFNLEGWVKEILVSAKMEGCFLPVCSLLFKQIDDLSDSAYVIAPLLLAEYMAERIGDLGLRARTLAELAGVLARVGETGRARWVAENTVGMAERIENPWQHDLVLEEVAGVMARVGLTDEALALAERIEVSWEPEQVLAVVTRVTDVLAQAGQTERARRVAEDAVGVTERFEDPVHQELALARVTGVLARVGLTDEAFVTASRIGDLGLRALALARVADALARAGEAEGARRVAEDAVGVTERFEDPWEHEPVLEEVAGVLARVGLTDEALALAKRIKASGERARVLAAVAEALAQAGQTERARRVAEDAVSVAERFEDPWEHEPVLEEVAGVLARVGLTDEALALAKRIKASGERARVLAAVAEALAQAGQTERARRVAEDALSMAERIENPWLHELALEEVAGALARVGLTDEALAMAERIKASEKRARVLAALTDALAQAGRADDALRTVAAIYDPNSRSYVQSAFTKALVREGSSDEAAEAMRVELAWARGIAQRQDAAECYATLATACLDATDHVDAKSTMREQWLGLARSALAHSWLYGALVWDHFDILMRVAPGLAVRLVNERILAAPEGGTDPETEPGCGFEGPGGEAGSYR
ncbi:hypothetical protein [Actinomyces sp. ZJ308]|uniref:hypothetical protein n=1 Tax=Actinomyces sp. ZJ308 TaxID=2708342 RepID=UPI00141E082D|nr:hypothetical protein [Actinomyces sp. ZJ308]